MARRRERADGPTADGEAHCCTAGYRKKNRCSWVGEDEAGERQGGDVGGHYGGNSSCHQLGQVISTMPRNYKACN
jgi:hypothetical protein